MSGHSKWHNIQKTKGAADAKRSAAFTKIAKEIIVAVKEGSGSGDPNNNSRLATVIAKAKAVNMPNDNIKRTIDRALGSGSTDNYEAVTYEGYGPGGVAVIVEALTDNRQRTAPEIRHYFDKYGKGTRGHDGRLRLADRRVQRAALAVEVALADGVLVHERERTDAGAGQRLGAPAPHAAQTEHGYVGGSQALHGLGAQKHLCAEKPLVHAVHPFPKTGGRSSAPPACPMMSLTRRGT